MHIQDSILPNKRLSHWAIKTSVQSPFYVLLQIIKQKQMCIQIPYIVFFYFHASNLNIRICNGTFKLSRPYRVTNYFVFYVECTCVMIPLIHLIISEGTGDVMFSTFLFRGITRRVLRFPVRSFEYRYVEFSYKRMRNCIFLLYRVL